MKRETTNPLIAIACGGTGGHLFPGLAVAEELVACGCDITLLISHKEVDQEVIKSARDMEVVALPAVGLTGGNVLRFLVGFWKSYRTAKQAFLARRPDAVLAMGGFTSAPPVLVGKHLGAKTFFHESNSIPGRANRYLAHVADEGFVYFHAASGMLNMQRIRTVGMPLRRQFIEPVDPASARIALGLSANKPVLLVMGGSQGASGINKLVMDSLPLLVQALPGLQFVHLTGANDFEGVQSAYRAANVRAVVRPFLTETELALGSATAAVSRAGASSLAEMAAMRLPAVLIPYPHAADDHQHFNAAAFVESGAALMIDQSYATAVQLTDAVLSLASEGEVRTNVREALAHWYTPDAASKIAHGILAAIGHRVPASAFGSAESEFSSGARNPKTFLTARAHV